jgi:hypothetical protein
MVNLNHQVESIEVSNRVFNRLTIYDFAFNGCSGWSARQTCEGVHSAAG